MPIENSLSFKGLVTSPNNLGAGSEGALVVADNVTIRYPDVLEPRRGQDQVAFLNDFEGELDQVFFFQDKVFVHSTDDRIQNTDLSTSFGEYAAADPDYRLKTAISASTLYMATDKGVMALEEASSTVPRLSGIAEPLKMLVEVVEDPTSPPPAIPGFLLPEKAVAYRVLFGYVDSHKVPHFGPPSVKVTVKNTSTTAQASVKIRVSLLTAPTDASGAIVSGTFVRVYRSVMADTEAATSGELYLVNETVIDTSVYTTDDVISIADTARQEFAVQSAPLYTNDTQGFLPNDAPPFARDLANWSERLWYANTEQPYSLTAQLIGVEGGGTPDLPATGLRVGDTVTIAGVTFTAANNNNVSIPTFRVISSLSAEQNISETLDNLAEVVNGYSRFNPTTFKIRAYLEPVVFGTDQVNFKIRFQRPSVDSTVNTAFSVEYQTLHNAAVVTSTGGGYYQVQTSTNHNVLENDWVDLYDGQDYYYGTFKVTNVLSSTLFEIQSASALVVNADIVFRAYGESVWTPDLSAGVEAENERRQNGLYYSLPNEPEAVSAAAYLTVGTSGRAIKRIVPQRDRLLVFKEEGTYAVYGDFPYQVSLIDDTVQILAPDSAIAIGSTVFVLTDDGVLAITDGGIQMVSKPIDSTLKPYLASINRNTTDTYAFGVAYESEKVFALFMPGLTGVDTDYEAKAYVYGLESGAWTTWTGIGGGSLTAAGRVDPFTDTAYYAVSGFLFRDRNTSTTADYTAGGVLCKVQWAATTLGAPHATKQARELHLHFREISAAVGLFVECSIKTDVTPTGQAMPLSVASSSTVTSIVGRPVLPQQKRVLIPQNVQRATYYTLGMIATQGYWALNGYSIVFENTSERTGTVR